MDDPDRFYALETRRRSLISTRSEPFEAGIAYFDDDYPERYISNRLVVPEARSFRSDQLIASADAIPGGVGLPHRLVTVLDDRGGRLAPGFRAAGFEGGRVSGMVLRRPPDRPIGLAVEECSFDEARQLTEEIYRRNCPRRPRPLIASSSSTRDGIASSPPVGSSRGSTGCRPGNASSS